MKPRLPRRWKNATRRTRIVIASTMAVMLTAGLVAAVPLVVDDPFGFNLSPEEEPVAVTGAEVTATQADPTAGAILTEPPAEPVWPTAAHGTVATDGKAVEIGGLPLSIIAADGVSGVAVDTYGQDTSNAIGLDGVVMRVADTASDEVAVTVGYAAFANAFGADWQVRLRFSELPECALTTPHDRGCAGRPLHTSNDSTGKTLTTTLSKGSLLAISAGASGSSGDYGASSLGASQDWSAGSSTGEFNWSYQVPVPPTWNGGGMPAVGLSYSSGNVDGRTAASNNQPSWLGEGFEYEPGYIERKYIGCGDDMEDGANNTEQTGDQCWFDDNAFLSYGGQATELIKDKTSGTWRPKREDGSKIEHRTGGPNGDDNGEYWVVTLANGTKAWFGRNRLPGWSDGKTETNSVWTVPVFGNHDKEPCHASAFADSDCDQAWRWQVDYVEDVWGNTISYWYGVDTNKYGRNLDVNDAATYVRSGMLKRIDYGTRNNTSYGNPLDRIEFTTSDRCLSNCADKQEANWPDTPWDKECTAAPCTDNFAPTFWTTKRLSKITTKAWDGLKLTAVDEVTLRHSFRDPGDGTRAGLFLEGITRTGLVGGTLAVPEITFGAAQMANRVDGIDNAPKMNWFRVSSIITETGGEILVDYSEEDCIAGSRIPSDPSNNTWRCYPVWWNPYEVGGEAKEDWFHKYVVDAVSTIDHTGANASPRMVTRYKYEGGGAWHYDDGNGLTNPDYRTWSQWRGYAKVTAIIGDENQKPTNATTLFHRGMDGDKKDGGGTKSVTVTSTDGKAAVDYDELAGMVREQTVVNYDTGQIETSNILDYWRSEPTASRTIGDRTVDARYVAPATNTTRALENGVVWRTTATKTTYDPATAAALTVEQLGDLSLAGDEKCLRTTYVGNSSTGIVSLPSTVENYTLPCSSVPATPEQVADPDDLVNVSRFYYDNKPHGSAPERGAITKLDSLVEKSAGNLRYATISTSAFDEFGHVVSGMDATGASLTTTFNRISTAGAVSSVTTTNAAGHSETVYTEPLRGKVVYSIDVNGNRMDNTYDPLGRRLKVWLPGRPKSTTTPNVEYSYVMSKTAPVAVTTKSLIHNGNYVTSTVLYDSLMRQRQSQGPAVGGGRIVSDNLYDSAGRVTKAYTAYHDAEHSPGTDLAVPVAEVQLPRVSSTVVDGLGRTVEDIFYSYGAEKWRTSYRYGRDRTDVIPPQGGTVTSTITDMLGRTSEVRQYHGQTPTGDYDATTYQYNKQDRLKSWTDPAGNTWSYEYDARGRVTATTDPDYGRSTTTYDDADRVLTSTDPRGETIAYTYDKISRPLTVRTGSATGPIRTEYTYDTATEGIGLPATVTKWTNGKPYASGVTAYNEQQAPLSSTITIPDGHGELSGSYTFSQTYNQDGSPATSTYPAAGGLSAETVKLHYDDVLGMPSWLSSNYTNTPAYVLNTTYTNLGQLQKLETGVAEEDPSVIQTFGYEPGTQRLGQHIVRRTPQDPEILKNAAFTYDPAGNITRIADTWTSEGQTLVNDDVQCFDYDYLGRMTEAWTPKVDDCTTAPTTATLGGAAPYWQSYTFDLTGNRTSLIEHATPSNPAEKSTTYTYPSPGSNQPHTLQSTETTTAGKVGAFTHTYAYDNAGNTTSRPDGNGKLQTLTWNADGQLSQVTDTDTGKELGNYIYGPGGGRLIAKDATGETLYLGSMQLHQDNENTAVTATRYYSYGGATVAVRTTTGGLTWSTADHQGTNQLAISQDTTQVTQRRQDPYGNPRGAEPVNWPDKKGFVGGEKDPTGLTHIGARSYDPGIGRFISDDPITTGDPQQANGYAYAGNTPITSSDPTGLVQDSGGGGQGYSSIPGVVITRIVHQPTITFKQPEDSFWTGLNNSIADFVRAPFESIADLAECASDVQACVTDVVDTVKYILENPAEAIEGALYEIVAPVVDAWKAGNEATAIGEAVGLVGQSLVGGGIKKVRDFITAIRKVGKDKPGGGHKGDDNGGSKKDGSGGGDSGSDADPMSPEQMQQMKDGMAKRKQDAAGDDTPDPDGGTSSGANDGDGGGGNQNCNCFVEGTPVAMADGTTKAIDEVRPGDEVTTYNTDTGAQESHTVTALFHKTADTLLAITVDTTGSTGTDTQANTGDPAGNTVSGTDPPAGDNLQTFTVTPEHPFWQADTQTWTLAGDLEIGDQLLQRDGDHITITAVATLDRDEPFTVYNFTVDGTHNYYATTVDTLVHNCGGGTDTYRADSRGPDIIHKEGFAPLGSNMDLSQHVAGGPGFDPSGYVATTSSLEHALSRPPLYTYVIRNGPPGIDVNSIWGTDHPWADEREIAVPGGIPASCIVGCFVGNTGEFIPNPNFKG